MDPLVLPGKEARTAEIRYHHGQEVLMEGGENRKWTHIAKEEEQRDEGPADAPMMAALRVSGHAFRTAGLSRVFDKLEQRGVPKS